MLRSTCESGAWQFIEAYFHDCVYSYTDFIGFCLGMTAIVLWITAQLPQFIDNIKNQSAEALSVWFLAQWFLGDTLNLLGCLMSGEQLPTTTALAMYFVLSDVVMLTQYVYFGALQRRKKLLEEKEQARRLRLAGSPGRTHHHRQHHRHQRHRASGAVHMMSDTYQAPPITKTVPHSFSHPPTQPYTLTHTNSPSPARTRTRLQTQHEATAHEEDTHTSPSPTQQHQNADSAAAAAGASAGGASGSPAANGLVVATVAVGSVLSLVALAVSARGLHSGLQVGSSSYGFGGGSMSHGVGHVGSAMSHSVGVSHTHSVAHSWPHTVRHTDTGPVYQQTTGSLSQHVSGVGGGGGGGGMQGDGVGVGAHMGLGYTKSHSRHWWQDTDELLRVLGALCGSASTVLYLSSRVSQIYKNWARKSADGLSVMMFLFTISANLCTGFSILLRADTFAALEAQLPWVLGAFGTVGLDVFIARQAVVYNRRNHPRGGLDTHTDTSPLLADTEAGTAPSHHHHHPHTHTHSHHHHRRQRAGSTTAVPSNAASATLESTNPLLQPLVNE